MEQRTIEMPALGAEGEECGQCRTPLAADQRYCLNCGHRRAEGRVDYESHLLRPAASYPPGGPPLAPGRSVASAPGNAWTPLSIVGSVAALGVMLLLGVMIGRDDSQVQVAAAPAPVASNETGTPATSAGGAEKVADSSKSGGGDGDKGGGGSGGGGDGQAADDKYVPASEAEGATEVSDDALEALESASGDDYAKQSKNLPDTIALPGEPPPTDNKEPGGGSKAVTIGD